MSDNKHKTKYPLSAFGPELMAALLKGSKGKVVLRFAKPHGAGMRFANSFRRRINTLRQRMRQENHPQYEIATRAKVSLFWGDRAIEHGAPEEWRADDKGMLGALVVIQPHDVEFTDVLKEAGVDIHNHDVTEDKPTSPVDFDQFLAELPIKKG